MSTSKFHILKEYINNLRLIENCIGSGETDNVTLNMLCKYIFKDQFIGVFMADEKFKMNNNEYAIINTDPHDKPGLHWVALAKYRNKIYYYDSFDRPLKN